MFRTFEHADLTIDPKGLSHITVKSGALGRRADVTAFVPEDMAVGTSLPIVTLLHGVFGSHWAWAFKGEAHLTARALIQQKLIPPMVLLMPSDGLWGDGSGYVPHADANYERWIVDEVPTIAFQLTKDCDLNSPRYLAGLSMGGFAALRLGAKYAKNYQAVSAHSSATHQTQLASIIEETTQSWSSDPHDQDVLAALQGAEGPLPRMRFDCGTEDQLLTANRSLHQSMTNAGIAHTYEELPGRHDWDYWKSNLHRSLLFFAQ
ncbi:MAG: alpha/beta hydrolase [Hyphomonadaceae bacterium]|jgi:putative tributyrin esterase